MCERTPIKVTRTPVTVATDSGWSLGKWFAFPKPDEEPPYMKTKKNERTLWCPWCGEWTLWKKDGDRFFCKGVCGWAHTEEWYVRTYNKLWYEDIPLKELQKMTIPTPAKRKR